jgi:hypothetical protein
VFGGAGEPADQPVGRRLVRAHRRSSQRARRSRPPAAHDLRSGAPGEPTCGMMDSDDRMARGVNLVHCLDDASADVPARLYTA